MVKGRTYRSPPADTHGRESVSSVPVRTGPSNEIGLSLNALGGYNEPKIHIETNGNEITASVRGNQETVPAGSSRQIRLKEASVEVFYPLDTFHTIQDERAGGTKKVRDYEQREILIRPVVTIKNSGEIDVYKEGE